MYIFNEWLRFLESPEEERQPPWEFELKCRVDLISVLDLGWAYFRFWEKPPLKVKSDIRSVVLRMKFRYVDQEESLKVPTLKEQHYHPKGPAGEFESLISLFTRAHFVLTKGSFTGDVALFSRYAHQEYVAYSDVDGSEIDLRDIQKYFDMALVIRKWELKNRGEEQPRERYLKKLIMAARFYHLALSMIELDDTLAYICLVSSIECMLTHSRIEDFSLRDVNPEAFDLLVVAIPDEDKREPIEKAILRHEPKIKQRFESFIHDHLSGEFWNDETRPSERFRFKNKKDVSKFVRRIYNARSSAIHAGEPFPKSSEKDIERPNWFGMQMGQKAWKEKELIPSVRAFERLVHHVLLESLRKQHSELMG